MQYADPVAAAWFLFYRAADIMDSVEDQDEPEPWWGKPGIRTAISAATGIYFTACQALNLLDRRLDDRETARQVREGMLNRFLKMGSGQHFDLINQEVALDQYWQIAGAKSGTFFAMGCWAGARLATDCPETLAGLEKFGAQIGLLIQILDDLKEFQQLDERLREGRPTSLLRSLPIIYVLEVSSRQTRAQLLGLLQEVYDRPEAASEVVRIIEENGGVFYLLAELERHRQIALGGLEEAGIGQTGRQPLIAMLDELYTPG